MLVATVVLTMCRMARTRHLQTRHAKKLQWHITGRTSTIVHDRRYTRYVIRFHIDSKVRGQGDTLQQGRLQNLYFATENSKSHQPHGLRFDSFHAITTSCHEVSSALRRAHAKAYRLGQQQDHQPRNPPHIHVSPPCASLPSILMHVQRSSATNLVHATGNSTPTFGRYNVTLSPCRLL